VNQKNKLFLSWSGAMSKKVAEALNKWIPTVLQHVDTFVSSKDIESGEDWFERLTKELNNSAMGIICITPSNVGSQWIHFEAGAIFRAAKQESINLKRLNIFLFHIDTLRSDIGGPLNKFQFTRSNEKDEVLALLRTINNNLPNKVTDSVLEEVFESRWEILRRELQNIKVDFSPEPSEQKYLPFKITRKKGLINIQASEEVEAISEKMESRKWHDKVESMKLFIRGEINEINDVGLAIGIQNFIYINESQRLLAGIRTKAVKNSIKTGSVLAKGAFNTGLAIIRGFSDNSMDPWKSPAHLQDLFHTKNDKKYFITKENKIYEILSAKGGKNICEIKFTGGERRIALLFVNTSRFYPRFEIGIMKYIKLPELKEGKYIDGFGRDAYEDENYWIWIDDGKIIMRSYSGGQFIPNIGSNSPLYSKQWILITNTYLEQEFGISEKFIPLASDEELNLEFTLNRPLSSPARSIAELF